MTGRFPGWGTKRDEDKLFRRVVTRGGGVRYEQVARGVQCSDVWRLGKDIEVAVGMFDSCAELRIIGGVTAARVPPDKCRELAKILLDAAQAAEKEMAR